jgi:hypothetical protein
MEIAVNREKHILQVPQKQRRSNVTINEVSKPVEVKRKLIKAKVMA